MTQYITYDEIRILIQESGVDQETQDFWLRYATNVFNADYLSEEEKQRKLRILLNAIDAKLDADYFNRADVILAGTLEGTFSDLAAGLIEASGKISDWLTSPVFWIVAAAVLLLILTR